MGVLIRAHRARNALELGLLSLAKNRNEDQTHQVFKSPYLQCFK